MFYLQDKMVGSGNGCTISDAARVISEIQFGTDLSQGLIRPPGRMHHAKFSFD